jgi:DNA-binding transcriptional regulator PaaX
MLDLAVKPEPFQTFPIRPCPEERRRVGSAIWLLLLLMEWTPTSDNSVRSGASIRADEIASALGIRERQARRQLQMLRRAGWVELRNTGRGFNIRLTDPNDAR